jgi:hypothetical protein
VGIYRPRRRVFQKSTSNQKSSRAPLLFLEILRSQPNRQNIVLDPSLFRFEQKEGVCRRSNSKWRDREIYSRRARGSFGRAVRQKQHAHCCLPFEDVRDATEEQIIDRLCTVFGIEEMRKVACMSKDDHRDGDVPFIHRAQVPS